MRSFEKCNCEGPVGPWTVTPEKEENDIDVCGEKVIGSAFAYGMRTLIIIIRKISKPARY